VCHTYLETDLSSNIKTLFAIVTGIFILCKRELHEKQYLITHPDNPQACARVDDMLFGASARAA
jgi:hypothetical protein